MQNVVVIMLVSIAAIIMIVVAPAVISRRGQITPLQVGLGIGAGLVAAFAALVAQVDLLPDGPDDAMEGVFVVGMTIAAVVFSWYRIVRA